MAETLPTLRVLREKFLEQEEPEAQDLALVSRIIYKWKSGRICT